MQRKLILPLKRCEEGERGKELKEREGDRDRKEKKELSHWEKVQKTP